MLWYTIKILHCGHENIVVVADQWLGPLMSDVVRWILCCISSPSPVLQVCSCAINIVLWLTSKIQHFFFSILVTSSYNSASHTNSRTVWILLCCLAHTFVALLTGLLLCQHRLVAFCLFIQHGKLSSCLATIFHCLDCVTGLLIAVDKQEANYTHT